MSFRDGGRLFDAAVVDRVLRADDVTMSVHHLPRNLRERLVDRIVSDVIEESPLSTNPMRDRAHAFVIADLLLPVIADSVKGLRAATLETDSPGDVRALERWNAALDEVLALLAER